MRITEAKKNNSQEISRLIAKSVTFAHTKVYPEEKIQNVLNLYKPENIEKYMQDGKYFIAIEKDQIVGCVLVIKDELSSLYVLPEHMRKGVGTELSHKAEDYISSCNYPHVWIWATLTAVEFYKARGYKEESSISDKQRNTWYIGMKKVL